MTDQMPTLAWSCRPDGATEFLNQRWLDYTGLAMTDAVGWGWKAAIHPDDLEKLLDTWLGLLATGETGQEEARLRRFDGEYRWFLFRAVPLRDERGKVIRWYGTNTDIEDLKRAQALLSAEKSTLELIAGGARLNDILDDLCNTIDAQNPKIISTVLLMDPDGKRLWPTAGRRVPAGWSRAITPLEIGPVVGSCGTAAFLKKPVIVADIANDPLFVAVQDGAYRDLALSYGLRASWSQPIISQQQEVLGTFALYFPEARSPGDGDLELIKRAADIAQIAIERNQIQSARKHAEAELRRSEAYLAEAQRLSRTGSFGWNVATGELFWSKETFCILGYPENIKPVLQLVLDRVHPEDLPFVRQTIERASTEATDMDFEHRLLLPDGAVKHLRVMAHAIKNDSGGLEFVGAVSDVTATKRAEEKIRRSETELRRIVELIPQVVIVTGPDGEPLYANRVMLDYTGVDADQVPSVGFGGRLSHPEDVEKSRATRQESLAQGASFQLEQRLLGKDGEFRWFLFRYNPLKDDRGKVARWYVTATDIHERKQAEERIQKENLALREEIDHSSMFEEIVGSSRALRDVLTQVTKVAPLDATVLILGETGTGKELIARAIHKRSARAARAFVRVNCASIPQSLIASELFGHEKGAFTGALQRRLGRFELADGGTIFLDEIGELAAEMQIALLRVLQEREFERVGSSQTLTVDVRVLAATNRDLKAAVAAGTFRQDLFYRLNVFPIQMPSLRERVDDIPLLVEYFIERYGKKVGKTIRTIRKQTVELFQAYDWPGNIRELQNVIERAVILCDGETFAVDKTWLNRDGPRSGPTVPFVTTIVEREKEIIEAALTACRGRIAGALGAAAKLGIPRQTLESKIKSLGIDKRRFKAGAAMTADNRRLL